MGPPGEGRVGLVDLPHEGGVGQTWEKVVGVLIAQEKHKKVYLEFFPDLRGSARGCLLRGRHQPGS